MPDMFDNHVNLLRGTVQTAPVPATTGDTLTLMPGDASRFTADMPVTLAPPNTQPDYDNSEIAYVTAVNGSVLTLDRGQEGTIPQEVGEGWQVIGSLTVKTVTDLEDAIDLKVDQEDGKGLSTEDYTTEEKSKLAGIASGATQNALDAALRDRSTHTGTQAISTVIGLQAALDSKVDDSELAALFVTSNLTVTVGTGGQYSTVNAAITYLSRLAPVYTFGGYAATINLLSGFTMAEQVIVRGIDLSWITITSEDAVVPINTASITTALVAEDAITPVFGGIDSAKLPIIGALFAYPDNGTGYATSPKDGIAVVSRSEVLLKPGAGVRRPRNGLKILSGSFAGTFIPGLTQGGGGSGAGTVAGVDFSYATDRAVMLSHESAANLPRSIVHHALGDYGIYVIWNSHGNFYQSQVYDTINGYAVTSRDSSTANMRESQVARSKRGMHALHKGEIDARSHLSPSDPAALWIGDGAKNCTEYGVLASYGGQIDATELDVSGSAIGVSGSNAGIITFTDGSKAENCTSIGIYATSGAIIDATGASTNGSGSGFVASSGIIIADTSTANTCAVDGYRADETGSIQARNSSANSCGNYGFYANRTSKINARGSSATGCVIGFYAYEDSRMNVQSTIATGALTWGYAIDRGSTMNGGSISGTINQAVNAVTGKGIIFDAASPNAVAHLAMSETVTGSWKFSPTNGAGSWRLTRADGTTNVIYVDSSSSTPKVLIGQGSTPGSTLNVNGPSYFGGGSGVAVAQAEFAPSTTDRASTRHRPGADPSSPNDGDTWYNSDLKFRKGSTTETVAFKSYVDTQDALKQSVSQKGVAGGYAELDGSGLVPTSQLPGFVDDVLSYANLAAFPVTGETSKIYVAENTNLTYRWSGSAYVEISSSLALGETSSTAYRGDRGKTAYDHSQLTSGNPHNLTKADLGIANVNNTTVVATGSVDLDTYTADGRYIFTTGATLTNAPSSNGFLLVISNNPSSTSGQSNNVKQVWYRMGTNGTNDFNTYVRSRNGASWSSWMQFATLSGSETLTQKTISGADNTISNVPQSAVTGLTTDLATKVAKGDLVFNIRDYGAVGNGSTNDTTAIQSAITAASAVGGSVYAPPGNYLVNGTVTLPAAVRLTGAGMDDGTTLVGTTFKRTTSTGSSMFQIRGTIPGSGDAVSSAPVRRVTMGDFTIRAASSTDTLIQGFYSNRNHFARVRFIGAGGHAFHGVEFWDTQFDACTFDLCGTNSLAAVLLQNRASSTAGVAGYSNDNINRLTFRSCTWESFSSTCIALDATSNSSTHLINNVTIDDCKFETSTFQVPMITSTTNVTSVYITDSYFAANNGSGGAEDILQWSGASLVVDRCRFYQGTTGIVTSAVHLSGHAGSNVIENITCNWSGNAPTSGGAIWVQTPATASTDSFANIKVDVGKRVYDETGAALWRIDPRLKIEADQLAELILDQTGTNPKKFTLGVTSGGNLSLIPNANALWTIKKPDTTNFAVFDMTNGRVGVGTNAAAVSPTSSLHVAGSMTRKTDAKTSNYTMTIDDSRVLVNATSANVTVTLPTAVGITGREYHAMKVDSSTNTVTVNTTSSQTINGISSVVIGAQYDDATFVSDGANWVMVAPGSSAMGIEPYTKGFTTFGTGGVINVLNSSSGTSVSPTAGTTYWAATFIPINTILTGIVYTVGSGATAGDVIVGLYNSAGVLVANSALAGTAIGSASTKQKVAFTSAFNAKGPGVYYIALQFSANTARFLAFANATEGFVTGSAVGTFGTLSAVTPGTTYTANIGPYANTY